MALTQINKAGLDEIALDHVFTIGASGSSAYTFQGEGLNGTVNNPTLYLTRGKTYRFENGSGGHPIRIQSTPGASGTAYNTGVTNNAGSGTVIVEVQHDAPDVLYYQCTSHAAMNGILYITGALADGGVTTAKIADDAVTNDKLANSVVASIAANTAKTSNATHTGDVTGSTSLTIANDAVTTAKIANGAVTVNELGAGAVTTAKLASSSVGAGNLQTNAVETAKIQDQAVTLAKLEHGTSSNDGKFLRANNGADPTFETISTTPADGSITSAKIADGTIVNADINASASIQKSKIENFVGGNANNRVITGTDTTNLLNGESGLVFDGSNARLGVNTSSPSTTLSVVNDSNFEGFNVKHSNLTQGVGIGYDHIKSTGSSPNVPLYIRSKGTGRVSLGYDSTNKVQVDADGLKFNADTAAANALDDYEEGSYTVSVQGDSSVQLSYTYRQANYVKIGKYVFVAFDVRGSRNNMNGQVYMSLPFTSMASGGTAGGGACNVWAIGTSSHYGIHVQVDNNTGYAYFTYQWSNNNTSGLTGNLFYSNTQLRGQFAYIAAS